MLRIIDPIWAQILQRSGFVPIGYTVFILGHDLIRILPTRIDL